MIRKARFKLAEPRRFNGEDEATVLIEHVGQQGMFIVRPKGSRKTYAKPLSDVAAWVVFKCAFEEAEATRSARKTRT